MNALLRKSSWWLLALAIGVFLAWCIPAEAATKPPKYVRAGYELNAATNDDCGWFIHPPASWRSFREMHTSCTLHAGAGPNGILLQYEYPGVGTPKKFGAVVEDETHGKYGDIPFLQIWREGRYGYIWIPGPRDDEIGRPNGIYVHVEHVFWNVFKGIRENKCECGVKLQWGPTPRLEELPRAASSRVVIP